MLRATPETFYNIYDLKSVENNIKYLKLATGYWISKTNWNEMSRRRGDVGEHIM